VIKGVNPQRFRDRGAGLPGWVLGGGGSLAEQNPDAMRGGVVIATNHQIWAGLRLGFPPAKHWVFVDRKLADDVDVAAYPLPHKWVFDSVARKLDRQGFRPANLEAGEEGTDCTYLEFQRSGMRIDRDAPFLHTSRSVLNVALHLAWILGCTPIHVRGADFDLWRGKFHWWETEQYPHKRIQNNNYYDMERPIREDMRIIRASGVKVTVGAGTKLADEFPSGP
jgi:hypothetical protein